MLRAFVQHAGSISSVFSILDSKSDLDDDDPLSAAIFTAKIALYITQTLIGDAFMVSTPINSSRSLISRLIIFADLSSVCCMGRSEENAHRSGAPVPGQSGYV